MRYLRNIILVLVLIILDQITKWYFFGKNIYVFSLLSFNYVSNTGVLFGFFKNSNLIFIFFNLLIVLIILYYYKKHKNYSLGFNFLLAGGIGNLIDRIFRSSVVDFIHLKFWPVFNLADMFITIGILLLLYSMFKEKD